MGLFHISSPKLKCFGAEMDFGAKKDKISRNVLMKVYFVCRVKFILSNCLCFGFYFFVFFVRFFLRLCGHPDVRFRKTPAQQETRRILAQSFRESERGSKSPRSKIDSFGGAIFTFMLRWYVDGFMSSKCSFIILYDRFRP